MKRILIIVVLSLLVLTVGTGWKSRPPTPAAIFTGATAADAMQQAATYLFETGNDPVEVYVTGPGQASDGLWRVAVVE